MSLKTISIGVLARAMAATSLLGACAVPTLAAAQADTPAQQAAALAMAITAAVENAIQNSTADNVQQNIELAIAAAIDGADPQVAQIALQQSQAMVSAALPGLTASPAVKAVAQQSTQAAFINQSTLVTAAINAPTGAVGNQGRGNNGPGSNQGNNANGNGVVGNAGNGIGGGPPGGAPVGGGAGGGGGGGGSHRR